MRFRVPDFSFEVADGVTTVGRGDDQTIVIRHISLSRNHTRIVASAGRYTLFDSDSKNGTYVNGTRVRQSELRNGDCVRFGEIEMQFVVDGHAERVRARLTTQPASASGPTRMDLVAPLEMAKVRRDEEEGAANQRAQLFELRSPVRGLHNVAEASAALAASLEASLANHVSGLPAQTRTEVEEILSSLRENANRLREYGQRAKVIIDEVLGPTSG